MPNRILSSAIAASVAVVALLQFTDRPAHAQTKKGARETIHIGIIDRTFFYQPVLVAIQNGFFADEGLNANMRFIRSGEGQAEGLMKGTLNFALSSTEGIMQNVEKGGPLRILAANSGRLSHYIVTPKKFKRVEDLKGANVGILTLTEGSFFNWQVIAEKHGLKYPGDYKVVETAGAGARHHLLLEGKIDVGLQSIPWVYVGEDAGLNNLGAANDYVGEWQFTTYNVNSEWAKANPAKAEGFLRALIRATNWIYANKAMAAEIAAREMNIRTSYAERAWDYYTGTGTLTRDLAPSAVGLRRVFDAQIKGGLLPASRTFDMSNYVAGGYLQRAHATVAKD